MTLSTDMAAPRVAARAPRPTKRSNASTGFAHYVARPIINVAPLIFAACVIGVLVTAWLNRHEGYLTAEAGIGYWLGIVGGVIMLLLFTYPLRKRIGALKGFGRVASWFRLHMMFGIIGPALVILHTNFKLGSLNSQLALMTMLIVVASGIVGRYLYAKVHRGLYGQHAVMRDVIADIGALKSSLGSALGNDNVVLSELAAFAPDADRGNSLAGGVWSCLTSGLRTRAARGRILRRARKVLESDPRFKRSSRRQALREIAKHLRIYFAAVKKAERLALFERIFGLWHHLHMPLFLLLVLSVTLHIVAVHRY